MACWQGALRRELKGLIALLAAGSALACGGPDAAPPAGGGAERQATAAQDDGFDPCTLVSAEEVTAVVGWQPTKVEPSKHGGGMGRCDYETGDSLAMPPQKVSIGILKCPYNVPCYEDLPRFGSSQELAEYRLKGYEGAYAGAATVEPLEGYGVPAIHQDMLGLHSVELYVAPNRLAYVTTFESFDAAKALAEKLRERAH